MHPYDYADMRAASLSGKKYTKEKQLSKATPTTKPGEADTPAMPTGPPGDARCAASLGGDPEVYVDTRAAARLCGVSASILNKRRLTGDLPRYFQPPGLRRVLYRIGDLRDWLRAGERTSTSEVA